MLDGPGILIAQVHCDGHDHRWSRAEEVSQLGLVFVRTGVFRRRVGGVESVLDSTTAYVQRPGEVQQIAHPAGADVCTSMTISPEVADQLCDSGLLHVNTEADLAHRWLVARARQGAAAVELGDRATEVVTALLAEPPPRARVRLVEDARAFLNARPMTLLAELAAELNVSPWYLSRVFHRVTGVTVSRYRLRLRARAALEQFIDGDTSAGAVRGLAEQAAELGFADQAHLTRVLVAETGWSPARLRALLRSPSLADQGARRDVGRDGNSHNASYGPLVSSAPRLAPSSRNAATASLDDR